MSENSEMVTYTFTDHAKSNPRKNSYYNPTGAITKITPHHQAGNLSMEQMKHEVLRADRQFSPNYAIDSAGRVGLFVPESRRSWCSGSAINDYLAVTIEVANDQIGGQWHVSDAALNSLVELCADICRRNGIQALDFTGDKHGNLTLHKYLAATSCPGPYLESKMPWLAQQVNAKLAAQSPDAFAVGDLVLFRGGPHYKTATAPTPAGTPTAGEATISRIAAGAPHPYHIINTNGQSKVYGWVDADTISKMEQTQPPAVDWNAESNDFVVSAAKSSREALKNFCELQALPVRNL